MRLKKIDVVIVVALVMLSGVFLIKAGYLETPVDDVVDPLGDDTDLIVPEDPVIPTPPTSLIPSNRKEVSPEDEGRHYDKLLVGREWWYYSAVFDSPNSELSNWSVAVSFNHMASGDLFGSNKPDLLVVSLFGDEGEVLGGMKNEVRYLNIFRSGTLTASSPGVSVQFEDSWAEGEYPNWHVHAEDMDIDAEHVIIVDLDFVAENLPVWTIGSRAFDKSESSLANYLFSGCNVSGTISIDGEEFYVEGNGHHEHSWSPKNVVKQAIDGWDWGYFSLDNGWSLYVSQYLPTPQYLTSKSTSMSPFGTCLLYTEDGVTELHNTNLAIKMEDPKIFPFVKMPAEYSLSSKVSWNPLYVVSQSLLYGTDLELDCDISVSTPYNKVWKFPSYVGMKLGQSEISGTLSWMEDGDKVEVEINGIGTTWSMRALF